MVASSPRIEINQALPYRVVLIHWVSVALVLIAATSVLSRELFEDRAIRTALLSVHRSAGLLVLVVTALRLLISPWVVHRGAIDPQIWRRWMAKLSHLALYATLVAIPLLGWMQTSASGRPAFFLGLVPLPSIIGRDRDLAETLESAHANAAIFLLAVVLLHSSAALWHHFFHRDATLQRMLASRRAFRNPGNNNT
jgi:cytochrome b561